MSFVDRDITLEPDEGKAVPAPSHVIKATKSDTGGAYSLLEVNVRGGGPPQHIHHAEEEAFYVLEGEVDIKIGEETIRGTVGSFVVVPRGTVHTFWNVGKIPAKLLIIFSPPGFEQFFFDDGDGEITEKYNVEVVGPPLGACLRKP
jgi:mannose-6-phosphate isomerase-like protein (cupin superfamily)